MLSFVFLQAIDPSVATPLIWLAIFIVAYFFILRPHTKRQKQQQGFIDEISKGDEVVTASGIIGRINKIEDNVVTLEVSNKTFMRVTKNAISLEMTNAYKSGDSEKTS